MIRPKDWRVAEATDALAHSRVSIDAWDRRAERLAATDKDLSAACKAIAASLRAGQAAVRKRVQEVG